MTSEKREAIINELIRQYGETINLRGLIIKEQNSGDRLKGEIQFNVMDSTHHSYGFNLKEFEFTEEGKIIIH